MRRRQSREMWFLAEILPVKKFKGPSHTMGLKLRITTFLFKNKQWRKPTWQSHAYSLAHAMINISVSLQMTPLKSVWLSQNKNLEVVLKQTRNTLENCFKYTFSGKYLKERQNLFKEFLEGYKQIHSDTAYNRFAECPAVPSHILPIFSYFWTFQIPWEFLRWFNNQNGIGTYLCNSLKLGQVVWSRG